MPAFWPCGHWAGFCYNPNRRGTVFTIVFVVILIIIIIIILIFTFRNVKRALELVLDAAKARPGSRHPKTNKNLVADAGLAQFTSVFFLYSLGRDVLRRHDPNLVDRADLSQFLFDLPALCGRLIPILGSDFRARLSGIVGIQSRTTDGRLWSDVYKIKKKSLATAKNRIKRIKDLLYENSVSLATAGALTLEEDILFKKKNLLRKRLVTWTSW